MLHLLLGLARGVDALNQRIGKSLGWLLVLTVFVSAYNAVVRKAFNVSSNGLLEIQWYLFGAVFLLGAAYTLQQNAHVRIDILAQHFSARTQIVLELLGYVSPLCWCLVAIIFGAAGWCKKPRPMWAACGDGQPSS